MSLIPMYYAIISSSNSILLLPLLLVFSLLIVVGIYLIFKGLFGKDEKLELVKEKLELREEELIFAQEKEKIRLVENELKMAHEKIERVYKPIKKAIRTYFDEIEKISKTLEKKYGDTTLSHLLSELQHESLLLSANPEDYKLLTDMNILWRLCGEVLHGGKKHEIGELWPVIIIIMERIEIKINAPLEEYAYRNPTELDEWWEHWQSTKK